MEKREPQCTVGGNADWCYHCAKQYGISSKNKNGTAYDPMIPPLEIYLKNLKTPIQKNLCAPMVTAELFRIAKIQKKPKCPSVDEWVKKHVVHSHNGILHSRKKKGIHTFCDSMDGIGYYYAK